MSELQEEGINAINLPLSPSHYELDPEDTMLGNFLFIQNCTFKRRRPEADGFTELRSCEDDVLVIT